MELDSVDVNQAFLFADIKDDVYIKQPDGFITSSKENFVYKLNKSLYGLQEASSLWFKEIDTFFKSVGFISSPTDPCFYVRCNSTTTMFIVLHVDDMAIASSDRKELHNFKTQLNDKYGIKDLGPIQKFLSYDIKRDRLNKTICLNQRSYITTILDQANMPYCSGSKCKGEMFIKGLFMP
jgi:hypothetical protein